MQKAAKIWPQSQVCDPWAENYTTAHSTDPALRLDVMPGRNLNLRGAQKYSIGVRIRRGMLTPGTEVSLVFGDTSLGGPGMRMLSTAHELEFRLAVLGADRTEPVRLDESVRFRIDPGEPAKLSAIAPSEVRSGEDFTLRVRLFDEFGNLREPVCPVEVAPVPGFELDCGSTQGGVMQVAGMAPADFPEKRVTFHFRSGDLHAVSNPVSLEPNPDGLRVFWGDLHAHSDLAQGLESPDFVYAWARDVEGLDFLAHVEHDAAGDIDIWVGDEFRDYHPDIRDIRDYIERTWELRKRLVRDYESPGSFVPFLGFEWASNVYGHMNVIYRATDAPIFYPEGFWQRDFDPKRLWCLLEDHDAITIPHHCSTVSDWAYASGFDWRFNDERFVRAVEIYSKWGCSEFYGCPRATIYQTTNTCTSEGLLRGYRFGFVGGSDSHASRPGSDFVEMGWDGIHRQSGLTAVYAHGLTRDALFDSLRRRHCYATTGARIIVDFALGGKPMGSVVSRGDLDGSRILRLSVHGTEPLARVEIIKNGASIFAYTPRPSTERRVELEVPDRTESIGSTDYYYLRVTQQDGAMAWASPIWVTA